MSNKPNLSLVKPVVPGLFVKGEKPIEVVQEVEDGDRLYYQAGKLNGLGLRAEVPISREISAYLSERYGYDEKTDLCSSRVGNAVMELLTKRGWAIAISDYSQSLTWDELVEWQAEYPDFVQKCYEAAVRLNNSLNPRLAASLKEEEEKGKSEEQKAKDPLD